MKPLMISKAEQRMIIEKFINDNPDLAELETKISRFNIFEAVGMVRQEIKHSNFIQFLLDPSEKHQLGDIFLKQLLLEVIQHKDISTLNGLDTITANLTDADVRREWRHIDLLIYSASNNFVCTIENKVDSSEGTNQLETYENVIQREFPHCQKLFIYLTKEGFSASRLNWLSISYGTLANIIEKIHDEHDTRIDPDISLSMRHYVDLIRRHLMSESDIAELCRKIYKQHRQAIDLIYEHRPDLRADIETYIESLIQEFASLNNLQKDSTHKQWIRFVPNEWDTLTFQKTCQGWTASERILMFEFWNEPKNLKLTVAIGPGELQTKEKLNQTLKTLSIQGQRKCKVKESGWQYPCRIEILKASDYENGDLDDLYAKIRTFWVGFINGDMKTIRTAISDAFTSA